jgi:hypothetical protein
MRLNVPSGRDCVVQVDPASLVPIAVESRPTATQLFEVQQAIESSVPVPLGSASEFQVPSPVVPRTTGDIDGGENPAGGVEPSAKQSPVAGQATLCSCPIPVGIDWFVQPVTPEVVPMATPPEFPMPTATHEAVEAHETP